jgi:hypothetical protein
LPGIRGRLPAAPRAVGGEARLGKYRAAVWKFKGKDYSMGETAFTGELAAHYPDRQRLTVRTVEDGKEEIEVTVVNKDKGWIKDEDGTKAMDAERLAEEKEQMYAQWISALLPLKDKTFSLAPLGEVKVDGRDAVGMTVTRKGHRQVNLFFDRKTTLLVKMEAPVKDEETDKQVWEHTYYREYQDVRGIQVPMRLEVKRDGKRYAEEEITAVELLETLHDGMFDKP